MALNITEADAYISANCIDIDDWTDADAAKKQRTINVASRILTARYSQYTVPDAAVYEFANVLATVYGDTARLAKQGVTSYSVGGVGSFTFKDTAVTGADGDPAKYIPQSAIDAISAANDGVKLGGKRRVGWSVL